MPAPIRVELSRRKLTKAYAARPWYQRNDCLGWIHRAKRPETKAKRLRVMLRELNAGEGYMSMAWRPSKPKK